MLKAFLKLLSLAYCTPLMSCIFAAKKDCPRVLTKACPKRNSGPQGNSMTAQWK